jgi:Entner-Doudoroff aldolase
MTKQEVRARIEELAIIPAVRASNADDALFAAEAVSRGGLPIVELTMTVPKATELIAYLVKKHPHIVVGAGTVLDLETARACLAAGAKFITSPGLDLEIVAFSVEAEVVVIPGVLTPSEIIAAVKARADFVKNISLLSGRRCGLCARFEGSLPQRVVHRGGRRQPTNRREIPGGRRHRSWHWGRFDPAARH